MHVSDVSTFVSYACKNSILFSRQSLLLLGWPNIIYGKNQCASGNVLQVI